MLGCWLVIVFLFGVSIGSFVNVACFRLPYEKSIAWPDSRCMSCLNALRFADNLPIIGYLRRRGRCRFCGAQFSSRYMWIELAVGLAFVGLYLLEITSQSTGGPDLFRAWHNTPGLRHPFFGLPPVEGWCYVAGHAALLTLLLTAALIDAGYRIIPTQITYPGTILGLILCVAFPWPWPSDATASPSISGVPSWAWTAYAYKIPTGLALWPGIQPTAWAPAGSWQLGLLTGVLGALAGMFVVRALKWAFEFGFGQEAVGLGDADLMMMAGAFLGWQVVVLALPLGALVSLVAIPALFLRAKLRREPFDAAMPFGPGLAAGVVVAWFGWPYLGEYGRPFFFDPLILAFVALGGYGCLLVSGLALRRRSSG